MSQIWVCERAFRAIGSNDSFDSGTAVPPKSLSANENAPQPSRRYIAPVHSRKDTHKSCTVEIVRGSYVFYDEITVVATSSVVDVKCANLLDCWTRTFHFH